MLALQHFQHQLKDRHVLIRTDNTTVVFYIKISEPVKFGTEALEMGGCPSPLSESQVSSRSLQSNSGLSVSGQSHTLGPADSQGSDSVNLGHLWQGRGGLICGQADNSLSDVVFRQGRARGSGPGCIGTQLAKIPLVCVSTPTITMDGITTNPRDDATCSASSPIQPWFYRLLLLLRGRPCPCQ